MIDLLIVLTFVLYSISVGFWMRKKASKNLEQYFLAGRSLKGWKAGLSMAATQYAADTPLLVTGLVATAGIFSLWRLWIYAIAFLLMGFVFARGWRRSGVLTDAEFTELRYGGKGATILRALKAIYLGTFVNCAVLAMVLLAATRIAEPFLVWHAWFPNLPIASLADWLESHAIVLSTLSLENADVYLRSADNLISILAIVSFTFLYSTTGGLRSVVATDVMQFVIMMVATLFYAGVIVFKIGGLQFLAQLSELYGSEKAAQILSFGPPDFESMTLVFLTVLAVQWFAQVNADGTGYLAQRSMACETDHEAKKAAIIFTFAQVLVRSLLWLPIVLGLLILYPVDHFALLPGSEAAFQATREGLFAQGIQDFLPPGIRGLMLTGMLAALASTLDTHLNWGASYWANDLYKGVLMEKIIKRNPKDSEQVFVARLSNIMILGIALFFMVRLSSIQSAWHLSLLFGAGLGVVLILRWLWERINLYSEITAILCSLILAPILIFAFPELSESARLLWMVLLSTVGLIAVTLLTPAESREVLSRFYERVKPVGFWQSVAPKPTEDAQQLHGAFLATASCSTTIFCLLIGLGKLCTGTSIFTAFPLICIVIGLALIPHWWRELRA